MSKWIYLFCAIVSVQLCAAPLSLVDEDYDDFALTEEDFPRLPGEEDASSSSFTREMPRVRGVVLAGDERALVPRWQTGKLQGVTLIDVKIPGGKHELDQVLKPIYYGQPLSMQMVERLKRAIVGYFKARGYPFVIVQVPEQDASEGVVQLVVLQGRLGRVLVEGNRWTRSSYLRNAVELPQGHLINEDDLAYDLYYLNRNPFRQVNVIYAPGDEPGDVDVILNTRDRRSARIYVGTENTGTETTGQYRLYTGFNWGNAFGLGHVLSYQYTTNYDFHEFQAHTVQYLAPLPWKHLLNVYGGYSTVNADLDVPAKNAQGFSLQGSMRYSVPYRISRFNDNDFVLGFDFKRTNNTFDLTSNDVTAIKGSPVNLTQLVMGFSGDVQKPMHRFDYSLMAYGSPVHWVADQSNDSYQTIRPGARNQWIYLRTSLALLKRFDSAISVWTRFQGQVSSDALLPSEQFGLGGYDTVRGYEERELNMDNAVLVNLELRSPPKSLFSTKKDALQALLFFDYGWGHNWTRVVPDNLSEDLNNWIMGAGPGIRYTYEPYFTGYLDWGIKLHHLAFVSHQFSRVHFGVTLSY